MLPSVFFRMNVVEYGLVSSSQIQHFVSAASIHASIAHLAGGTSTSLEPRGTRISYRLLDGLGVRGHLPDLYDHYQTSFRHIAERVFGKNLMTSPNDVNGVNVNVIESLGGRYEWHYDSNPVTGLLALSPSSVSLGGRLIFGQEPDTQVALSMSPGDLFFFDATRTAHAVEGLVTAHVRATVPMNYFVRGEKISRPHDLDEALYGSEGRNTR